MESTEFPNINRFSVFFLKKNKTKNPTKQTNPTQKQQQENPKPQTQTDNFKSG